jgi:hypothetical protein
VIDWTKPIETVDGREARRLIGPVNGEFHCVYTLPDPESCGSKHDIFLVDDNGFRCDDRAIYSKRQEPFIRNVKVKRVAWCLVSPKYCIINRAEYFRTEEFAQKAALQHEVVARMEWEE